MRILIDLQAAQSQSRFRGIGRYSLAFVRALLQQRTQHEIVIALSGLFPDTLDAIRLSFADVLAPERLRVWYAPGPVREAQSVNAWRRAVAELTREAFLAELQPDVVHVCSLFEGFYDDLVSSVGCWDRQTPVSISLYDLIPLAEAELYLKPDPAYAAHYQRKLMFARRASLCLAISEHTALQGRELLGLDAQRIVNVSAAADRIFRPVCLSDAEKQGLCRKFGLDRSFVLYTGGGDERKNLTRLLQSFALLPQAIRDRYQLLLAGKALEDRIERLTEIGRDNGLLSDQLRFAGYVDEKELVGLYNLCDLFVFPSLHEGFGLPVLEAMACGAPVIAAQTTSLPEVLDNPAALFDPSCVFSMRDKLCQGLTDTVFREQLRKAGLQRARQFSWQRTAEKSLAAWETLVERDRHKGLALGATSQPRPRLAFVSPLPPQQTGIADYSARLLKGLSRYYAIELVVAQKDVDLRAIGCDLPVRDVDWLLEHAAEIDRIVYQLGNSPYHRYQLPLLQQLPGVVVLHDVFLSALMAWREIEGQESNAWVEALYRSHGYIAVQRRFRDAEGARQTYPAGFSAIEQAQGLIVHSRHAQDLVQRWYGAQWGRRCLQVPLVCERPAAIEEERASAKKRLGCRATDFLVCSFGFVAATKQCDRLVRCWLGSALARDRRCHLVFVGQVDQVSYGGVLRQLISAAGMDEHIHVTGYVATESYRDYLAAADLAVQLRTDSRGETSASLLDCLAASVAVIANAHGSMAEMDAQGLWLLADEFTDQQLVEALETLWRDPDRRHELARRGQSGIVARHQPEQCACHYVEAIEWFYSRPLRPRHGLPAAIAALEGPEPEVAEILTLAAALEQTFIPCLPDSCLFLDVTATCKQDRRTGIERVVRSLLLVLLQSPPPGWRVEPVRLLCCEGTWQYCAARRYSLELLGCPTTALPDGPVMPGPDDLVMTLDLSGDALVQAVQSGYYRQLRAQGTRLYALVFDLLPVRSPQWFPPQSAQLHQSWLEAISTFDGALCISATVAEDLRNWHAAEKKTIDLDQPYRIDWFHLGADLDAGVSGEGCAVQVSRLRQRLARCPSFLMVGTVEPRKAYLQAVSAFTCLWQQGVDVNLVIVGREGWRDLPEALRRDIPATVQCLRQHPEAERRLFWFDDASDETLEWLYQAADCLLAASYDEGFGLPLVEAALRGLPVLARDIPVFREVAGDWACYFTAHDGCALAGVIQDWLASQDPGPQSESRRVAIQTWQQSAGNLLTFCGILRSEPCAQREQAD
ncbi:glycosyltransferase [Desulfuromonas thiophila]|uniref:glycosyltransferase n=1 Tax=Desulfuromonas thiophila TaxID=57664 RepID=UPI0029F57D42|nr:glycosyltransferase [Desulfuromonas thiophila]